MGNEITKNIETNNEKTERKINSLENIIKTSTCGRPFCEKKVSYKIVSKQRHPLPILCHNNNNLECSCSTCSYEMNLYIRRSNTKSIGYLCDEHLSDKKYPVKIQKKDDVKENEWYVTRIIPFQYLKDKLDKLKIPKVVEIDDE